MADAEPQPTFIPATINPITFAVELAAAGLRDGIGFLATGVTVAPSLDAATFAKLQAVVAAHNPSAAAAPIIPDNPTLGDWRVALTLWGRIDDVTSKVAALVASTDPSQQRLGKIASERLNYSNNVLRAQLLQLKDAFGFTAADVDESLWRADRVSKGDLSGVWPLPDSN